MVTNPSVRKVPEIQGQLLAGIDGLIHLVQRSVKGGEIERENATAVIDFLLDARSASSRLTAPRRSRQKAAA